MIEKSAWNQLGVGWGKMARRSEGDSMGDKLENRIKNKYTNY